MGHHLLRVQELYPTASIVGKDRVVFRLKGGRLSADSKSVLPIGSVLHTYDSLDTHAEYDRINAEEV